MRIAIENPMVVGLARHLARKDRCDNLADKAFVTLRDELIDALLTDPAKLVRTPGFGKREHSAADVVSDNFAGASGDAALHELLSIVGLCAKGNGGNELHMRAKAWIAARAAEHAAWHQDDLLAELEGDE